MCHRLQELSDRLGSYFTAKGLMVPESSRGRTPVKLHVTLMNSRYTPVGPYVPSARSPSIRLVQWSLVLLRRDSGTTA